jgi:hypothetical protein
MQKWFLIIPILILFSYTRVVAQGEDLLLLKADSLYQKNKFAEAQAIYLQLYKRGFFTEASLLKMAFVHEGLGQTAQALFFLSDYFNKTEDTKAYEKIQTIANAGGLVGYELSDFDRATLWLNNRVDVILPIILSCCLFFLASTFYCTRKAWASGKVISIVFTLFFSGVLFCAVNFLSPPAKAMVVKPTYFMAGPSPASNFLGMVNDGNLVLLEGELDVWAQVKWNGKAGYIKKNDMLRSNRHSLVY